LAFRGDKGIRLDTTSIRLPFGTAQQNDPVMSRLRRMRERNAAREEAAASEFWDRSKAAYSRMSWWRGKMRWFIAGQHAQKIKANMQVEQSLGREQPMLWQSQEDQSQSGSYRLNLMEEEQRIASKNSSEMARISGTYKSLKAAHPSAYSIDPLMQAEREYMASMNAKSTGEMKRITTGGGVDAGMPAGGYDRDELAALIPADDMPASNAVEKAEKKSSMRNLRLLQIHNREIEIEMLAEQVLGDIQSICMDKPEPTPQHKAELKVVQGEVLQMPAPVAEETVAVPGIAPTDVAIWG
jgi:hypothetical protein